MKKIKIIIGIIILYNFTGIAYGINELTINDETYKKEVQSGKMTSINFDTIESCNNKKNEFSLRYTDYNRSECFRYKNNFNYFICAKPNICNIELIDYLGGTINTINNNQENITNIFNQNSNVKSGRNGNEYWFTIGLIRDPISNNSQDFINDFSIFDNNDKYYVNIINGTPSSPKVIKENGEIYYRTLNGWIIQNNNINNQNPFSLTENNQSVSSENYLIGSQNNQIRSGNNGNEYWYTIGLIRDPISNNSQNFINDFSMFSNNDKYYITNINGNISNPRVVKENGEIYVKGINYWYKQKDSGIDEKGSWFTIGFIRNLDSGNSQEFIEKFNQFNNNDKFYVTMENGVPKNPRVISSNGELYYMSRNGWEKQSLTQINNNRSKTTFGILYTTLHCPTITNNGLGVRYTEGDDLVFNNPNFPQAFYYWGKPELGHYCLTGTEGESVLRKHAQLLTAAGIDYIIIDSTNHAFLDSRSDRTNEMIIEPTKKLLQVWNTIPNAPKVVMWVPIVQGGDVYKTLLQELDNYPNLKFNFKGKPLVLNTTDESRYITDNNAIQTLSETMTVRDVWALNGVGTRWQFMNKTGEQGPNNGEQISVSPAYQVSYMTSSDAVGKNNGETFKSQFSSVFANPGIETVLISSWNEWVSIRLQNNSDPNKAAYTDTYNEDKNRDIEPQDGGKGDFYYQLMKKCISSYKQGKNSCE